ncbi:ABC transporter permease [Jiella pelagia]|uniref:ABC transporter permease n=1 Tax=Jiella pelagia TaxID=2986949 RepID=A0ABY7BUQ3_9HYPH|nr:ABC transporter permease [Jiella pelagia]WAP66780.1 ABC transporter permease [Jiella pelagia]
MSVSQSDHIHAAIAARNDRGFASKAIDWIRTRPEGGIAVLFVLVQIACIVGALAFPSSFRYLSEANIAVLLKSIAPIGIMALGVGVLMIAGEFDLSVGALYSFCAIVAATITNQLGGDIGLENASALAPFIGMAIGLAIGTATGVLHAQITLRFGIPSFITTLGAMLLWKGATLLYHGAASLRYKPSEPFATIFNGHIGVVHASIIWFAICAVIFYFILHHHRIGNHFYAVGGNQKAAVAIGINPGRTKTIAFAMTGFMAALSGIIAGARVSSIQPGGGLGLEARRHRGLRDRGARFDGRARLDPRHRARNLPHVHDPGCSAPPAGTGILLRDVRRRADRDRRDHEHGHSPQELRTDA